MDAKPIRLNIGGGGRPIDGFVDFDIRNRCDARDLSMFGDGTVDEIRASHVLEHLSFAEAEAALREWARALRPGGVLRVAVPDVERIAQSLSDPLAMRYLMGGQTNEHDYHRSAWTRATLTRALHQAGFDVDPQPWRSELDDCAALPVSLNVRATRCQPPPVLVPIEGDRVFDNVSIRIVFTGPRLSFTDHALTLVNTIHELGIPYQFATGAYWHQCIDRLLTQCLADDVDIAITLDYDSVWIPQQLDYMIHTLMQYPQIDALAPLQCKRETGEALLNWLGGRNPGMIDASRPFPVASAHFGLTLFRVKSLARMPRPWFTDIPAPDGTFGDGRIDPDMAFWKRFHEAGLLLALCPAVRIGHLQMRCSAFDESMQLGHPTASDWLRREREQPMWRNWRRATEGMS